MVKSFCLLLTSMAIPTERAPFSSVLNIPSWNKNILNADFYQNFTHTDLRLFDTIHASSRYQGTSKHLQEDFLTQTVSEHTLMKRQCIVITISSLEKIFPLLKNHWKILARI